MSCRFTEQTLKNINDSLADIVMEELLDDLTPQQTRAKVINLLKQYHDTTPLNDVVAAFKVAATELGLYGDNSRFFASDKDIENIIKNANNSDFQIKEDNSEDLLQRDEQAQKRADVSRNFSIKAYGAATDVKNRALKQAGIELSNTILIDRINGELVLDDASRNRRIRNYQERLLQTVVDYLREYYSKASAVEVDRDLFLDDTRMYVNGEYTGIVEKISALAKPLSPETVDANTLIAYQHSTNEDEQKKLQAYNAWQILTHFDSLIVSKYGKAVEIHPDLFGDGRFTAQDKYKIASKGSSNNTTWRNNEDIDVFAETDKLVIEVIETTRRYQYGSNDFIDGDTLLFSEYTNIISKIKDAVWNPGDYDFTKMPRNVVLSSNTRTLARQEKTLSGLINKIRLNPQKYLPAVFEVLSNANIMRTVKDTMFKGITNSEMNVIYSLYKEIFGNTGDTPNSINFLESNSLESSDLLGYISQSADSLFAIRQMQYVTSPEGITYVRNMRDGQLENLKRNVEQTISNVNSKLLNPNYGAIRTKYNINPLSKDKFTGISFDFTVGNDAVRASVYTDGTISYINTKTKSTYKPKLGQNVINFVNKILRLNIDPEFVTIMARESGQGVDGVMSDLLNYASRVMMLQYVSNVVLVRHELKSDIKSTLNSIFGEDAPDINTDLKEIKFTHKSDVNTLEYIAKATAVKNGLYSGTQVKSGSGASQSTFTFSRLLGSVKSQLSLQNANENSATRDSLFVKNPALCRGIYTAREIYTSDVTKDHTEFNVAEYATASLLYDYIGGLMPSKKQGIVGNGLIGIIPSVNSDKSTIGRIIIDTNQVVEINGEKKPIRNLNTSELKQLISKELGDIYKKSYDNINKDWEIVFDQIAKYFEGKNNIEASLAFRNLKHEYLKDFRNFKELTIKYGIVNPADFIKQRISEYNKYNYNNPIALIDQVHFIVDKKGNISSNQTLVQYLYRYNSAELSRIVPDEMAGFEQSFVNADKFWAVKNLEVAKSLLDSGFSIDLLNDSQPEIKYLKQISEEGWIDNNSQELIIGKLTLDIESDPIIIKSKADLQKVADLLGDPNILNDIDSLIFKHEAYFDLNPLIEKYNYLDYLFSQEFMISTVGSCLAHPAKGDFTAKTGTEAQIKMLEMEAARYQAQHKRNVSYTAAMQEFELGLIDGIPENYNIAIIDDIKDVQYNVQGDIDDGIKPYDGATFVNPFIVYLENNSLKGARAGITKKQFVHFYDERTGTGGIIKTAGFGLTNDWMRNSPRLQLMMKKMTKGVWRDANGKPVIVDITKDFDGKTIEYKDLFYKENGIYYRIDGIEPVQKVIDFAGGDPKIVNEANTYKIKRSIVDEHGLVQDSADLDGVDINNNHKLWQVLGGVNSMEMSGNTLIPSENSISKVADVINKVGTKLVQGKARTQNDVHQPLKHSDIHYIPTAGAVKQGAANINGANAYSDDNDLHTMRIHMYQAGIQLDKEHHADHSELSLMTQVMSACSHKGYTASQAMELYSALRTLTDNGTEELLKPLQEMLKKHGADVDISVLRHDFIESINNVVLNTIAKQQEDEGNLISTIASDLLERVRNGQRIPYADLQGKIPLDNPQIFPKFVTTVAMFFTNNGIKMKIPGILSVLCPSFGIFKLYGDKKWEEIENSDLGKEAALEALQAEAKSVKQTDPEGKVWYVWDALKIGRTYLVTDIDGNTSKFTVTTPKDRRKLKELVSQDNITDVVEWVKDGRDLASYDVFFNGQYSLYDLDSVQALFEYKEVLDSIKDLKKSDAYKNAQTLRKLAMERDLWKQFYINNRSLIERNPPQNFDLNKFLAKLENTGINTISNSDLQILGENYFRDLVQQDQIVLSKRRDKFTSKTKVYINNNAIEVDVNSINIIPYELIMPKTFIDQFGLNKYDQVDTIINDTQFFYKRLKENYGTKLTSNNYDIELKRVDGKHIYLKRDIIGLEGMTEIFPISYEDGKPVRKDINTGKTIFNFASEQDRVFVDQLGNEVIVTSNPAFYLQNIGYQIVQYSNRLTEQELANEVDLLKAINSKQAKRSYRHLTENGRAPYEIKAVNTEMNSGQDTGRLDLLWESAGQEMYAAFKASLEVIASRTPSQSMQSFMPMRIVAFDNPNINTAHVSTAQIWLQGSDFDIDAVSLATFEISAGGKLELWSPHAQVTHKETSPSYADAMTLPFPTRKKTELIPMDQAEARKWWVNVILNNVNVSKDFDNLFNLKSSKNKEEIFIDLSEKNFKLLAGVIRKVNELGGLPPLDEDALAILNQRGVGQFFITDVNVVWNTFAKFFDEHNLYLENLNQDKLASISKNYSQYQMLEIIKDPMNLQQAQSSVDTMTGPFKKKGNSSVKGQAVKFRTPGNFLNKAESIVENQVGREAIGICATGMKAFFGLTAYNNYVLNKHSNNEERLRRLVLGPNGSGITLTLADNKTTKTYTTLANINPELNTLTNLEKIKDSSPAIRTLLESVAKEQGEDAALQLSALLSLATDNAKELQLSKLNAGTKTIGMYIYAISIGMDFNDIADILMSPVGEIITNVMEGNQFQDNRGLFSLDQVFNHFEKGPNLSKFDRFKLDNGRVTGSLVRSFNNVINQRLREAAKDSFKEGINYGISEWLPRLAWTASLPLQDKLNLLDSAITALYSNQQLSEKSKKLIPQLKNYAEQYIKQVNIIKDNVNVYDSIKKLANGAQEMRIQGSIFSLNQGLSTKAPELVNRVNTIQNCISDRQTAKYNERVRKAKLQAFITNSDYKKPDAPTPIKFDLVQFCFDDVYREEQVKQYDAHKHTINILDSISTVPHFFGYLRSLATAYKSCFEASAKMKVTAIRGLEAIEEENISRSKDKEYAYRGTINCFSDVVRAKWMRDENILLNIPTKEVVINQRVIPTKEPLTTVSLGTRDGDATFKLWMEKHFIPSLQDGNSVLKDNKFIKDLIQVLNTKNPSKNALTHYTLNTNMMPRSDSQKAAFDVYKSEFNKISEHVYSVGNQNIPMIDLFYYYGLIAHYGKPGETSLMPIFENQHGGNAPSRFHKYEALFAETVSLEQLEALMPTEIMRPYILPIGNTYTAFTKHVYEKDKETMEVQLYKKQDRDNDSNEQNPQDYDDTKNGYKLVLGFNVKGRARNYYTTGNIELTGKKFKTGGIEYNFGENSFIKDGVVYQMTAAQKEALEKAVLANVGGIDENENIQILIDNITNPC